VTEYFDEVGDGDTLKCLHFDGDASETSLRSTRFKGTHFHPRLVLFQVENFADVPELSF